MEEVAGVTAQARIMTSSLYLVMQKELLTNSIPGRPTNQPPRMFMSMLAALEELTVDDKSLPYYRVYAWWILLQSWGAMRFSDHRGLKPSDVQVTGNTMSAKLTRSKTTGDDKDVAFRMVHISSPGLTILAQQTFQETSCYQLLLQTATGVFGKSYGTTLAQRCRTEFCHHFSSSGNPL